MKTEVVVDFLEKLNFTKNKDDFYVGKGQNNRSGEPFKILLINNRIVCHRGLDILFHIPQDIKLGTFIVLCQEFGIIHERYIYERVEAIYEEFEESEY